MAFHKLRLSDEEPEEGESEGVPEDDGDLGPDKFDEDLNTEEGGNRE